MGLILRVEERENGQIWKKKMQTWILQLATKGWEEVRSEGGKKGGKLEGGRLIGRAVGGWDGGRRRTEGESDGFVPLDGASIHHVWHWFHVTPVDVFKSEASLRPTYMRDRLQSWLTVLRFTLFSIVNQYTLIKNFRSMLKWRHTKGLHNGYHFQQCTEMAILWNIWDRTHCVQFMCCSEVGCTSWLKKGPSQEQGAQIKACFISTERRHTRWTPVLRTKCNVS